MFAGLAVLAAAVGCSADDDQQIVVSAASSLTDAFDEIETEFEAEYPNLDVVISYGGSSSLVAQLVAGAPVDVLATADEATMENAVERGGVSGTPEGFASNSLVIAVEAGNPLGIRGLDDLSGDDLTVVLAAPEVPAGAYAAEVFERAGVEPTVASYEQSVRAVAAKIALGEADAGVVYLTDALAAENVDVVDIPTALNVRAVYPIAAVGGHGGPADDFTAFVLGDRGRVVLAEHGFGGP